jgi:hypothetical protein
MELYSARRNNEDTLHTYIHTYITVMNPIQVENVSEK